MYILPVIGSGADADNGMAHLVSFIHSFMYMTCQACVQLGAEPVLTDGTVSSDARAMSNVCTLACTYVCKDSCMLGMLVCV